ncbi:MAG TPA: helix-turn-helix domain-containing protein [Streptosporangiaceae bacterium]|jgi:DNA-binding HxlR family transcriptional regulator|nr:helix-turn-helix domain-containing protein [Streptosporangiaceae bacterium]
MSRPWVLDYDTRNCTIGAALAIVGEKWTFLVLREAFNGVRRFDDIRRRISAPRQILSDRLNRLVSDDLLRRVPYQEPGQRARSEYRLTEKGLGLFPVIVSLLEWGNKYAASPEGPVVELTHRDCGAPVRLQLACEDGHAVASAREVTPIPGPGARMIA